MVFISINHKKMKISHCLALNFICCHILSGLALHDISRDHYSVSTSVF